jgi:hypothetical protein
MFLFCEVKDVFHKTKVENVYFLEYFVIKVVCHIFKTSCMNPKNNNFCHHYETLLKDVFGVLELKLRALLKRPPIV